MEDPTKLENLPTIATILILAAIILGVGALAFNGFKDNPNVYETLSFVNGSFSATNGTFSAFTHGGLGGEEVLAVSAIRNGTGYVLLETANYILSLSDGTVNITNVTGTYYVDYTYKGGYAWNITELGEQGIFNMSDQFATIGTIIGVIVLLGLIVGGFYVFRGKSM